MQQQSRADKVEGLLIAYVASKRRGEAAEALKRARAAHAGLLDVFFQVEGTASKADIRLINRALSYLDRHIKTLEMPGQSSYEAAKREVSNLYN